MVERLVLLCEVARRQLRYEARAPEPLENNPRKSSSNRELTLINVKGRGWNISHSPQNGANPDWAKR